MFSTFIIVFFTPAILADVYFHNPRGSNNRLNEPQFPRKNDKRLFDSQNNDRGGYNVGSVYHYHGSELEMEWTNQHSCGGPNNNCDIIIQYMCDKKIRDGESTRTIPENSDDDSRFGRHESYYHYLKCKTRRRNLNLFVADQKLRKDTAIHTRQNPKGTRYGYECPEERDYFPYWHNSPWKDIAILTNSVSRCGFYQRESQNVKPRWECVFTFDQLIVISRRGKIVPNTESGCLTERPAGFKGVWTKIESHNISAPECREVQFTRDNHLGNSVAEQPPRYSISIPDVDSHNCVFRIRYNISTSDYDPWETDSRHNPDKNKKSTKIDLASTYKFSTKEKAEDRGYVYENNPEVKIFNADFTLELAINTAQYGRLFQDRSHVTGFRKRPSDLKGQKIHNVNVRGKRGNIVQVYPAVEYDFVPNDLDMSVGDFVHFQWTGSDQNPNNAAGNGRRGTDRSNVVLLNEKNYNEVHKYSRGLDEKFGHYGNNYPEHLHNSSLLGFMQDNLEKLAYLSNAQYGGVMSQLDDASPYFDLKPVKVTKPGSFYYMSTRNNDFTNRDQKAAIHAFPYPVASASMGFQGGHITVSDKVNMVVSPGALCGLHNFKFQAWPRSEGDRRAKKFGRAINAGEDYASDFVVVYPIESFCIKDGKGLTMNIQSDEPNDSRISVYHTNPQSFASWKKIDSENRKGHVSFNIQEGGAYVLRVDSSRNIAIIVGAVIGVILLVTVIGSVIYFKRHREQFNHAVFTVKNYKRAMQSKV